MKTKAILLVLMGLFFNIFCQEIKAQDVETYGKTDSWFLLLTDYKFNDNWSLTNELHMRFDDGFKEKQQFVIRPCFNYTKNKQVVYSLGYTYVNTFPYSEHPLKSSQTENNVWEQITLNHKVEKFSFSHRYRLEQRFVSVYDTTAKEYNYNDSKFQNRFRYRITIRYDINEKVFFHFFDELWIHLKSKDGEVAYDRNWLYAGFGYKINPIISMQVGYLHQYIKKNPYLYERHPTVQLTLGVALK